VNEIGGNKIPLRDGDMRVFLDFGMSFSMKRRFCSPPFLSPKSEKSLQELEILPKPNGIYKFGSRPPEVDTVFVSHSHLDHSTYLSFINRQIPIYSGETTQTILQALGETRRTDLGVLRQGHPPSNHSERRKAESWQPRCPASS
jgi:Cft2 family RNA processing exonuclease